METSQQFINENPADNNKQEIKNSSSNGTSAALLDVRDHSRNTDTWFRRRFWSCPTSLALLREAEKSILSYITTPIKEQYVTIPPVVGEEKHQIWTLSLTENHSGKTPIVLVHGLGSGVALWSLNLGVLAADRPVYAFDLLGFASSSRPEFNSDPHKAEMELVESIEEWRKEMKLERMVILGHSFGGFLATSYAIKYPSRISHLILADPWGFSEKPADPSGKFKLPFWVKGLIYLTQPLNPLWAIRTFGFRGPGMVQKYRGDLIKKFADLGEGRDLKVADYIFQCNTQIPPSGEIVFRTMASSLAWAKNPMIERLSTLDKDIPMTLIYGGSSYLDHCPEEMIRGKRPEDSYVDLQVSPGAGHHVNADNYELFNDIVRKAAAMSDDDTSNRPSTGGKQINQEIKKPVDNPEIEIDLKSR